MTAQDDPNAPAPEAPPAAGLGGGLLGLVREEVTALRTSAAVERAVLIDTIASKLTDLEQQLSELRADVASARSEGETSRLAAASAIAEVNEALKGVAGVDLSATVQQAVATQMDGIVEAVVAAVRPQLEHTAAEVTYLRNALLGPAG
jgi:cell division septum initiation protein DivIVA